MGKIGDPSVMPVLLDELKRSKDLVLRLSLIRGLGLLKNQTAMPALQELLLGSANPLEQTALYDAMNLILGDDAMRIAEQIASIAEILKERGSDWQTQLAQAAVTDALDRIIKKAEDEAQKSSGQGQGKSRQTSQQSSGKQSGGASKPSRGRTPATSTPASPRGSSEPAGVPGVNPAAGVAWGNLPPAVQEEVTAALKSDMPERYRRFLEIYYKILAEGK